MLRRMGTRLRSLVSEMQLLRSRMGSMEKKMVVCHHCDEKAKKNKKTKVVELTFLFKINQPSTQPTHLPHFSQVASFDGMKWRLSVTPIGEASCRVFAVHAIYQSGPLPVHVDLSILLQRACDRTVVKQETFPQQK